MILLLGASGYVGSAFVSEFERRGIEYHSLSRTTVDYTKFRYLRESVSTLKPDFIVNCAGYTGVPNVDTCEVEKTETILGNLLLPQTIAQVCEMEGIPMGHVSSGCIFSGARIRRESGFEVVDNTGNPELIEMAETDADSFRGFSENDIPNFTFRNPPCSFYSGTKAAAEELLLEFDKVYIWRLRIPFDEFDGPRNYLSKIQRYPKVYNNINSLSHRGDFVCACLDLWKTKAPFGVYNMTNPGFVTTRGVVRMINNHLDRHRTFEFWADDEEFYQSAAKTPRSNCILDTSRLIDAGISMRPVEEAVENSLKNWTLEMNQKF